MATEADLIQKFKDLNIPVGADFEELIHAAFAGANLADLVNNYDSRITTVENDLSATKGSIQSKVTDNKDGTEQLNGVKVQPFNKLSDTVGTRNYIATNSWIALGQYGYYTVVNGGLIPGNGSIDDLYSDYISISPQTMLFTWYSTPTSGGASVHAYDATKTWIKSRLIHNAVGSTKIDLPSNTAYIAINVPNPNARGGQSTLTIGDVKTDWTPAPEDKADDSKVAHLSGANNFDTVPTVNNNPLLLASSLPSDLARTTKDANFTGKLQKSGIDVATKSDVTTAVSTATANMVDSTKATNFTAGLKSGGVDVATAADLKSIEASSWRQLDNKYISTDPKSNKTISPNTVILYKLDTDNKRIYLQGTVFVSGNVTSNLSTSVSIDFSSIAKTISFDNAYYHLQYWGGDPANLYGSNISKNKLNMTSSVYGYLSISNLSSAEQKSAPAYVNYDELV